MVDEAAAFSKEDEDMRKKFDMKNKLDNHAFTLPSSSRDELLEWLDEKAVAERSVEEFEAKLKACGKGV